MRVYTNGSNVYTRIRNTVYYLDTTVRIMGGDWYCRKEEIVRVSKEKIVEDDVDKGVRKHGKAATDSDGI